MKEQVWKLRVEEKKINEQYEFYYDNALDAVKLCFDENEEQWLVTLIFQFTSFSYIPNII